MPDKKLFPLIALLAINACLFSATARDYPQSELVVNISGGVPDWRPHKAYNADEAQILTAICEGLFVYDPYTMDPTPAIAQSWVLNASKTEWTFILRKDAKFSNGDRITAGIIANSWFNLLDPAVQAPYASLFDCISGAATYRSGASTDRKTVGISAVDEYTLKVTLASPAEHLPKILCHHAFSAVHPSGLAQARQRAQSPDYVPVSSGPFMIQSISDSEIMFVKNPYYWDAVQVSLPSIKVLVAGDAENLTYRFNLGEIHWLAGSTQIERILDPASIQITPMFSTEYFFFRATWGPWADGRVRNALLRAVPWSELRSSYVIPATTLVFPIAGYPKLAGIEAYSMDEAKKMLADAGYTDLSSVPPLEIRIPETAPFITLAEILKKSWTELGFAVEIRTIPYAAYYQSLREDTYAIGITSWIGDFADPLSFLEMFRPDSSLNDSGWKSPAYEKLIGEASSGLSKQDRYTRLSEAERVLLDEGIILPIAHNPALNVIDTNGLGGWYSNALDIHPFKFIRFVPKKPLPGVASVF